MALTLQRFSTAEVDAEDRVDLWEDHNARALLGLTCRTLDDRPLDAWELNARTGALDFARVRASSHVVERTGRHISEGGRDEVVLYFLLAGESFFYHRDGVLLVRPGELLVCDVSQPFSRGFARGLEELVLKVPRPVFEGLADHPAPLQPTTLRFHGAGADPHAASLARLVGATVRGDAGSAERAEDEAIQLLGAAFSREGRESAAAYRRAALRFIEQHLGDPRLSVPRVAAAVGLSERQLSRVFREQETTVAREILERRLARACALLRGPGTPAIGSVARQCGFTSHAHFTRAFGARFGVAPSELRRSSQAPGAPRPPA